MTSIITMFIFCVIQTIFTIAFLSATNKCLNTSNDKRIRQNITNILISPFAAYIYISILGGYISVASNNDYVYVMIASMSDVFVLILSVLFAFIYAKKCKKISEWNTTSYMAVYMFFVLFQMAFNWTYSTMAGIIVCGIIVPVIILCLFSKYLTTTILQIKSYKGKAKPLRTVFILAMISAVFFIFRSTIIVELTYLSIDIVTNSVELNVYMTIFTYLLLTFLLVGTYTITTNVKYTQTIEKQSRENEQLTNDLITSLVKAIDIKDKYTNGHSVRVAKYSVMMAESMTDDEATLKKIHWIALLHDIGKLGIPDEILNKPGKLTDEEYAIIKSHTTKGAEILAEIKSMPDIIKGAKYHHERYDGKGYPNGLSGDDIPEIASLIAVADSYDAMTSKRSYRDVLPQEVVRSEIEKNIGKQFHPKYAKIMLELIDKDTEYNMRQKDTEAATT